MNGQPRQDTGTVHDDRCAERIRVLRLAQAGDPPAPPADLLHEIAVEIQSCCGHVALRAHRLACGWTVTVAIRQLHICLSGEGPGHPGVSKRAWQDWETGKRPNRHNQDLLCRLFGTGPVELGFAKDYRDDDQLDVLAAVGRFPRRSGQGLRALSRGGELLAGVPGTPSAAPEDPIRPREADGHKVEWVLVADAAHESSEHAAAVEAASVGPNALEQIGDDIIRIARAYVHSSPLPLFGELLRVRDRAYWLLDRTRNPSQQHDLYLMAGQACGLLASASFDLGYARAAAQQARAARAYAEIIEGNELSAWADGMLACIEMWAGRPGQALLLAQRGLAVAPEGTCRIRLCCIAARAAALQGDEERATDAIAASKAARDTGPAPTELHDGVGGEFGFGLARQAFCNGSAYLKLGRTAEAMVECQDAIRLYGQDTTEERWYAAEAGARADLAATYLWQGDVAGAREAVSAVLVIDPGKRVEGVVQRFGALREMLAGASFQDREGRALADEIEEFTATPALRALPSGPC